MQDFYKKTNQWVNIFQNMNSSLRLNKYNNIFEYQEGLNNKNCITFKKKNVKDVMIQESAKAGIINVLSGKKDIICNVYIEGEPPIVMKCKDHTQARNVYNSIMK